MHLKEEKNTHQGKQKREMERSKKMASIFCIVVALLLAVSSSSMATTMEENEKECVEQLTNLAACIPFVSGDAKKPTPQCCEDTKKVKSTKPKCLCVLIKESTDPSMGLPVNTTLALQMPSACNIDAKVSDCPSLLNLSPDSLDAKIFKQANSDSSTTSKTDSTSTPASTLYGSSSSSSSSSSPSQTNSDSKATPNNNSGAKMKLLELGSLLAIIMCSIACILV